MKRYKVIFLCLFLFAGLALQGQIIHYSYDAAGNRVAHYIETEEAQLRVTPGELTEYSFATEATITIENLGNTDMNWSAVSNNDWIEISGDANGTNNGTITLVIAENTGAERYGSVTITAPNALNAPYELNITQYKANHTPIVENPLPDISRYEGFSSLNIDISDVFFDEDYDSLYYTVENEDNSVAMVSLSGSTLTITEVNKGLTRIYITADDNLGGTVTDDFRLSILDVNNNAPYLANPLIDQVAEVGVPFSYIVPENTFVDNDEDDSLTYTAELNTGQLLPEWLHFDSLTRTFSGIPVQEEVLLIRVIATDLGFASAADIFSLTVNNSSDIVGFREKKLNIFPNPTNGIVYISSNREIVKIKVSNVNGKIIISKRMGTNHTTIDLSHYPAGIYFFTIETNKEIITEKIILTK